MSLVVDVRHSEGCWSAEDIIRGSLVTFDESTAEKSGTEGPATFQTRMWKVCLLADGEIELSFVRDHSKGALGR